jgi:hypothetical protein
VSGQRHKCTSSIVETCGSQTQLSHLKPTFVDKSKAFITPIFVDKSKAFITPTFVDKSVVVVMSIAKPSVILYIPDRVWL